MSGLDKVLISDMMESFVIEAPPSPFVSYCVVCNVFLTKDEMVYEKGNVFHRDCFEKHGKEFPDINQDLISQNSNAKVQLIQLKNLKVRQLGTLNQSSFTPKPQAKAKTKRKSKKKRPKRKMEKKRRSSAKRKKTKKRSKKNRTSTKRRIVIERRKKSRRSVRKTRSGVKRRPARRRTSQRKTKRRR
jgi:hypothetical protein